MNKGYCESCAAETEYIYDEYSLPVCVACDNDVNLELGLHVEDNDYDEWGMEDFTDDDSG